MNPIRFYRGLSSEQRFYVSTALLLAAVFLLHGLGIGGHGVLLAVTVANATTNPTIADLIRQRAPNGSLMPIVESMSKLTPFLQDATFIKCNFNGFHRVNRRNALPAPVRRRINKGVPGTKSGTQQVDEVTTKLSDKSTIDVAEIAMMGGPEYRAREVAGHMMGFEQQVESDLLTGSIGADPDGIDGIETRLSATTNVPAGNQLIKVDAAPTGSDQASIILAGWAPHGVHAIYPDGAPGGLNHKDYGEVANGGSDGTNTFPAYIDWFEWDHGLAIEDYRYVARASNIDTGNILSTGSNILDAMITLFHRCLTADGSARWGYYMPRFIAELLHKQARNNTTQSTLRIEEIGGQRITTFLGIPCRTADLMTIAEGQTA